jgi:hypothetical protein
MFVWAQVNYSSCSDEVMEVMKSDVMQSAIRLVEDLLGQGLPVLLYQVNGVQA